MESMSYLINNAQPCFTGGNLGNDSLIYFEITKNNVPINSAIIFLRLFAVTTVLRALYSVNWSKRLIVRIRAGPSFQQ